MSDVKKAAIERCKEQNWDSLGETTRAFHIAFEMGATWQRERDAKICRAEIEKGVLKMAGLKPEGAHWSAYELRVNGLEMVENEILRTAFDGPSTKGETT